MTDKLDNFVIFPRKIAQDRRAGLLSKAEYDVYVWVRHNANPYGVSIISLSDIKNDVFGGKVSENYTNKLLISLKSKKYVYYHRRVGRRGSFEVHFGDWPKPDKTIKQLDYLFNPEVVRDEDTTATSNLSEPSQSEEGISQSLNDLKIRASSLSYDKSINKKVRASYNDTDTDKENDTNRMQSFSLNRNARPQDFLPNDSEQQRCCEIALALGEQNMAFMLSVLEKNSILRIEEAWSIYQDEKVGKHIKNKGAYFNSILQRLNKASGTKK